MHRPLLLAILLALLAATSMAPAMSMRGSIQYIPQHEEIARGAALVLLVKARINAEDKTLSIELMNAGNTSISITRIDLEVQGIGRVIITPVPQEALAVEVVGNREYTRHTRGSPVIPPGRTVSYIVGLPSVLPLREGAGFTLNIYLSDGTIIQYYGVVNR